MSNDRKKTARPDDITGLRVYLKRESRKQASQMEWMGLNPNSHKDQRRYARAVTEMAALRLKPGDPKDWQRYLSGMKAMGRRRP